MIAIHSEIGRLERVLVHEPGLEVDMMVPAMMEELLFDDILFGPSARAEHAQFRRVFQLLGVDVVDAHDLLTETLADAAARRWIVEPLSAGAPDALREALETDDPARLAERLVVGVRRPHESERSDGLFLLPPVPNWCFQRDPQIAIGDGVLIAAMATPARQREALLASTIFRFHPGFRHDTPILWDPNEPDGTTLIGIDTPCIEGGDVLVISPDVLAIGFSARTNEAGIRAAARALTRREGGPRWLIVVEIPQRRAYMHLDTVMTPIDRDACLVHAPVVSKGGGESARVYQVDLHAPRVRFEVKTDVLSTLASHGVDYEPINCGGQDLVRQQREQWTDGANAFCLAPGVITLYERNVATLDELARHGFEIVGTKDLLLGQHEIHFDEPARTCIVLEANEITRARGGPHCLTHALARAAI